MAREVMERRAADNPYLHRDFHSALNHGMIYLHRHFGEAAVKAWLRDFALEWYKPLRRRLAAGDLGALREHVEAIYRVEGAAVGIDQTADELQIRVSACPAVAHMRSRGEEISPLFVETTRTVNEALCDGTPFVAELLSYDPQTGACVQRFRRRSP